MDFRPQYRLDRAVTRTGDQRFVVTDPDGLLHGPATDWLMYLHDIGRSTNTVENYGSRLAWYLSWTSLTTDWRGVSISHIAMWKHTVTVTPARKTNGEKALRSEATVDLWMTPVRAFYEWADSQGHLTSDVAGRLTQLKYFPPGSPGGGEHGSHRRVIADELRSTARSHKHRDPEWMESAEARERLELLELNVRDRLIVDLLYFTGLRVGELLSLFSRDMHLGGGSKMLQCRTVDPHFHIETNNPVENRARAKGCARTLIVPPLIVERYVDYVLERRRLLGDDDSSPHVFVNLYTSGSRLGGAMHYSGVRALLDRISTRIDYDVTGPHMLRHTLATRLIRGIDCEPQAEDVVGAILGHRSATSTRIYTHDTERAKKNALASIRPRSLRMEAE